MIEPYKYGYIIFLYVFIDNSNDGSVNGIEHRKRYQYWLGTEDDFGSFQNLGAELKLSCTGADTHMCKLVVSWYLSPQYDR